MSEKLLEMKHFRVVLYPEEPESAPPGSPESPDMGKMRQNETNGSGKSGWVYNDYSPGSQNGNPA